MKVSRLEYGVTNNSVNYFNIVKVHFERPSHKRLVPAIEYTYMTARLSIFQRMPDCAHSIHTVDNWKATDVFIFSDMYTS